MSKIIAAILIASWLSAPAQKFVATKSTVIFFSKATVEDISAKNSGTKSTFDVETGNVEFSIPVKEFVFSKSLMRQHFNSPKYMDSEKYPNAEFEGTIAGFQMEKDAVQKVIAKGKLTIHGVTKDVEVSGIAESVNNTIVMKSKFIVKLDDYNVPRPQLLYKNIAEQVEVTIDLTYTPYEDDKK